MMTTTTTGEKSRVLVVDDEPQITRVLRTVLTSQGYQVQTAAEGESALANFAEWRPELNRKPALIFPICRRLLSRCS